MKNSATVLVTLSLLFVMTQAGAHDGDIDSCGGHINRVTGEYHLHNYKKYRDCQSREERTKQAERKMIYKCGTKNTCKEMANCKEAMFYFENCGLSKLDKDKDGIPCEKLCK